MPLAARPVVQRLADLAHDVLAGIVTYGVNRVHPQAVEAELLDPVERVVDEEIAHRAGRLAVVVDGRTPRRLVRGVEELRAVGMQVVAFGAEVVVDHVDQHHQAEPVGVVDQRLELVGRAVGGVRREGQHAVVAPVALARKVGQRHELDRGDAQLGQRVKALPRGRESAFGREGADVQFVDHRLLPRPAAPGPVLPCIGRRVDDAARAVHVLRVEARGRVRHAQAVRQAEAIAVAGPRLVQVESVPAFRVVQHAMRARAGVGPVLQHHQFDGRCPQCEAYAALGQDAGAEGHGMHALHSVFSAGRAARLSSTKDRPCSG